MNQDFEDDGHEDFQMNSVCSTLKYDVNVFGMKINIWVLLLVVAVVVGLVMASRKESGPVVSDMSLSDTSSMETIAQQMGGFARSLSTSTPAFIRNLRY